MSQITWHIIVTVLLCVAMVFSAVRYARFKIKLPSKIALVILRTAWLCALLLAVWQPTIKFERFENTQMKIPVLIDASLSMQNFLPSENVLPFIDTLIEIEKQNAGRMEFKFFMFGDSLRELKKTSQSQFDDGRSFFPNTLDKFGDDFSSDMIIITDGAFTRPRKTSEIFPRNTLYYLTLPNAAPSPFVSLTHSAPETSLADSAFFININTHGYALENSALTVTLKERSRTVQTETVNIEKGHFANEFRFRTKNSRPGRRLYSIEVALDTLAPRTVSSFVHQTIPHFLTYSIYSARPTLDRRYIANALSANDFFRERRLSPDILFLFDYDSTAASLIRALPRHAAKVFIGALPCSTFNVAAQTFSVRLADLDNSVLNENSSWRNMAPPQEIITCRRVPATQTRQMLVATVDQTGTAAPLLFSGRFMNRQTLFVPVRGTWRWDFWSMSIDRAENELFGFSNILLSLAKEILLDNISDQFILYPKSAFSENDSAQFMMSLPAATPVFEPLKLSVQIKNENVNIDTLINYLPQGLNKQPLSFAPLPQGQYAISATIDGAGVRATVNDTFVVNKDMSELTVSEQNTRFLQEFATPLDMRDSDNARRVFNSWSERSRERRTVTDALRLHRSWFLLLSVLVLFCAELVLRRIKGQA